MRYVISMLLIGAALGGALRGHPRFAGPDFHQSARGNLFRPLYARHGSPAQIAAAKTFRFFSKRRQFSIASRGHCCPAVSRSRQSTVRSFILKIAPFNTGKVTGTTNFIETNPLPVTDALLAPRARAIRYLLRALPRQDWAMATALPRLSATCRPSRICTTSALLRWLTARFSTRSATARD